jgi:putative ABC transport system substrate-binding protein
LPAAAQAVQDSARALGLVPHAAQVSSAAEVEQAFARAQALRVAGVNVLASPFLHGLRALIIGLAARTRLPAIYQWPETAREGGLMGYGPSNLAMFRQLAGYAARILRGAKPAELPIEQPTRIEFVINLRSARAIGVAVPRPLLLRADEVIQ